MVLFVILAFYRKRDLGSGVPNRGLTEIFPLAERSGDEKGDIWCQNEKCGPALPSSDSGVLSDRFSAGMSEAAQKYLEYRSPVSSLKPEEGSFVYSTVRHICAPPRRRRDYFPSREGGEGEKGGWQIRISRSPIRSPFPSTKREFLYFSAPGENFRVKQRGGQPPTNCGFFIRGGELTHWPPSKLSFECRPGRTRAKRNQ